MAAVNKVLVIGGGFSGMAAAIQMSKGGIAVDLVEIDPDWSPLGAGITINGATLRALHTLGVYEQFLAAGFASNGVDILTATGHPIATLPTPQPIGAEVSGGGGIMRPALARLLADATLEAGVSVRLGCTYKDITVDDDQVTVSFTDGTVSHYDLVVGADGINSKLREQFFPEIPTPEYIGQGVWRAVMPRPEGIERPRMWLGEHIKLGINPVSASQMYMFITEDRPTKEHIDRATWPAVFTGLMDLFSDPVVTALKPYALKPESNIDYRPMANLLVPVPWNRGRLVMIGDTVAATTPHLASGAGIGIESGIVLGEELVANDALQPALDQFHQRRWERCRMVVENSERLCMIEIDGGDKAEHSAIMGQSMAALRQPI
ncbi:FAD-dependent oxidoreductase [Amphritea sp.]|uniref:FAD-dependent oxidoreductase n=1 Tax=Amphritea sp. TaxID=1872502 RepID=UPI003A9286F7